MNTINTYRDLMSAFKDAAGEIRIVAIMLGQIPASMLNRPLEYMYGIILNVTYPHCRKNGALAKECRR